MPRIHARKTNRGNEPKEIMEPAAKCVKNGKSLRSASKSFNISKNTLKRYTVKKFCNFYNHMIGSSFKIPLCNFYKHVFLNCVKFCKN